MTGKKPKPRRTPRQRAEFYLRQRREYATTTFNAVGAFAMPCAGRNAPMRLVERDEELMAALEAWRQRQLAEVDEALRKLGIADPEALVAEIDRARGEYEMKREDIIEAAMKEQEGYGPDYFMMVLS